MEYPLDLTFKILAIAPQLTVTDRNGDCICYVKQKLLKLKESVSVYTDNSQSALLCKIDADRVIDFSATYSFSDADGTPLGGVKRQGFKSLWRSSYDILDGENPTMTISEENPWVKVADHFFEQIPVLGGFSGYFFHPSYLMARADGQPVMRIVKQPAFLEGKFRIELMGEADETDQMRGLLSILMMTLLERARG